MPTYQYVCTACDQPLEAVQSFTDAALTECPRCGGRLRKVYGAVGVVFKGSGFYKNDSRSEKKGAAAGAEGGGTKADGAGDGGTSTGGGETKKDAPAPAAASSGSGTSGSGSSGSGSAGSGSAGSSTSGTSASKAVGKSA